MNEKGGIIMQRTRLHHVGIVMPSLERAEAFLELFGFEKDYMEYVESYHAHCLFTQYGQWESPIELIIPTEGVLCDYNGGKGGIHHIALEVEDVEAARREYEAQGKEMLEKVPVEGAGGIIVNFLRPRHGLGILVEFVENKKK